MKTCAIDLDDRSAGVFLLGLLWFMTAETNPSSTHTIGVPVQHKPQDYYSVLAGVINHTRTDSAQLRSMVYELARFNLKREALFGYPPMSIQDLARHMNELEKAIASVEANS